MTADARRRQHFLEWVKERNSAIRPLIGIGTEGVSRAVVIPVLAESENLFETLRSLAQNPAEELDDTLVICVVNNRAEPFSLADQVTDNQQVLKQLEQIVHGRSSPVDPDGKLSPLRLAYIDASSSGQELGRKMGVGEARRIGLDTALGVLCRNGCPDGLLISLDGDSLVEPNYFQAIAEHFAASDAGAGVVAFAHPVPDDPKHREAILLYEG